MDLEGRSCLATSLPLSFEPCHQFFCEVFYSVLYTALCRSLSGIHETADRAVAVTFNVIVPLNFWLWDNRSKIFLRFGDDRLGKWNDVGQFQLYK